MAQYDDADPVVLEFGDLAGYQAAYERRYATQARGLAPVVARGPLDPAAGHTTCMGR